MEREGGNNDMKERGGNKEMTVEEKEEERKWRIKIGMKDSEWERKRK